MPSDLTEAQASDLARYFLGRGWIASTDGTLYWVVRNTGLVRSIHSAPSWREAFRNAGVKLPTRPRYTAHGPRVMLEDCAICTAVTNTMAKRIAGALNEYVPDRRGI
jgi:hypothetical protein